MFHFALPAAFQKVAHIVVSLGNKLECFFDNLLLHVFILWRSIKEICQGRSRSRIATETGMLMEFNVNVASRRLGPQ